MDEKSKENLKKILEEQSKLFKSIEDMLPILQQVEANLKKVNQMTGAAKRAKDIREEIKLKGWEKISKLYHPENNSNDPAAVPLFEFYKYIYNDMKSKGEIPENSDTDVA